MPVRLKKIAVNLEWQRTWENLTCYSESRFHEDVSFKNIIALVHAYKLCNVMVEQFSCIETKEFCKISTISYFFCNWKVIANRVNFYMKFCVCVSGWCGVGGGRRYIYICNMPFQKDNHIFALIVVQWNGILGEMGWVYFLFQATAISNCHWNYCVSQYNSLYYLSPSLYQNHKEIKDKILQTTYYLNWFTDLLLIQHIYVLPFS